MIPSNVRNKWQKYNYMWCWYCTMWGCYHKMWEKKITECDNCTVICVVGTAQWEDDTIKCEKKNKEIIECDKNIVTCDVSTVKCEDDTIKYEKK